MFPPFRMRCGAYLNLNKKKWGGCTYVVFRWNCHKTGSLEVHRWMMWAWTTVLEHVQLCFVTMVKGGCPLNRSERRHNKVLESGPFWGLCLAEVNEQPVKETRTLHSSAGWNYVVFGLFSNVFYLNMFSGHWELLVSYMYFHITKLKAHCFVWLVWQRCLETGLILWGSFLVLVPVLLMWHQHSWYHLTEKLILLKLIFT